MIGCNNIFLCRVDFKIDSEQIALLTKIHGCSLMRENIQGYIAGIFRFSSSLPYNLKQVLTTLLDILSK